LKATVPSRETEGKNRGATIRFRKKGKGRWTGGPEDRSGKKGGSTKFVEPPLKKEAGGKGRGRFRDMQAGAKLPCKS